MKNMCDGWSESRHETEEELHTIVIDGCIHCGGIDCDDTGDVLNLCDACLNDLKNSDFTRYEIDPDWLNIDWAEESVQT